MLLSEIEKYSWLIDGVTTTPTFFKEQNINQGRFINSIRKKFPRLELHIEALGNNTKQTEKQIKDIILQKWFNKEKVIIKIPISFDNLMLVKKYLEKAYFNVHLIFNSNQAALASVVGAKYICPLIGRYADALSFSKGKNLHGGKNDAGRTLLKEVISSVTSCSLKTKVMASSIRTPGDFHTAIMEKADVVTISSRVLSMLFDNEMTAHGIKTFLNDLN